MPAIHHQPFQVRFYECDANGKMHNIYYLRRMQEAAFEASAAVEYDFETYTEIGHLWLVRETEIEYFQPLTYRDKVEIKTWVLDFRHFRSRRMYEFRNQQTGQLTTRASTDWVFINAETLRPTLIPEEMQRAFFPEGVPEEKRPRKRFPTPTSIPYEVFSIRKQVRWRDIDSMWHVNNAIYLAYTSEAEAAYLETQGWSTQRMLDQGFRLIPQKQHIEYRQPAFLGDELEILVWYSNLRPATGRADYQIIRVEDGQLLAQAQSHWMCVEEQSGRQIELPQKFLEDFSIR